ncbi:hypothetical protein EYC87_19290 [Halieaceae bacterium IMCC8485]|uniref:AAA+ ATPase domain-containing protein n=1 Tax=Candidatus Seongchinamella marina TaxID=2518990 RepID=A0ABT3T0L9_9GAMM|nr:hypothetical protein [Candidatus Seongchinamella marina]MCX2975720.1 hypothetical protein [Candidatus Seongchinamella marina]
MPKKAIIINPRYKSSTRIDSGSSEFKSFIDDFIIHGTAINTLDTLCAEVSGSAQRAYTLTGPYGSGKSTLALYLAYLISKDKKPREEAHKKLKKTNKELSKDIKKNFKIEDGWLVIKHVCGIESPAQAILLSILESLNKSPNYDELKLLSDEECLSQIKAELSKPHKGTDGIILLLDEMGKALDFQSREGKDLHIFQSLADIAQQAESPAVIVGFLHQAFTEYAKNKDASSQNEWAKVQGRYRDLSYNPSIDESLVLVGESINILKQTSLELKETHKGTTSAVSQAFSKKNRSVATLEKTLPLDPLVSLLLGPISRRRFSQNERSIFGFLASQEKLGFREFLVNNYETNQTREIYHPERLWDYLHHNLHHLITTSLDSKAWLEGCDAIYRAEQKGNENHVIVTKVIALLTIFGFQHQIHASEAFLNDYFSSRGFTDIGDVLAQLQKWTVIIYRPNHKAFFVFQGSDIDINNLVLERIESISHGVDWTRVCEDSENVLATAHYQNTGTMRWAKTRLLKKLTAADIELYSKTPTTGEHFLSFVLSADPIAEETLKLIEITPHLAVGNSESLGRLKTVAIELLALRQIEKEDGKINHDLIAKKEIADRIHLAEKNLGIELNHAFRSARWRNRFIGDQTKNQPLSVYTSRIADRIYAKSPTVLNELVNRSKPSGSANAGIRKLMSAMLERGELEDLGFDKNTFPAEKAIYLTCIKSKGWHQKTKEGFLFTDEWNKENIEENPAMHSLMLSGIEFIKNSKEMVTLEQLYAYWMAPPFGLTAGLCRLYGMALLKAMDGKIAFYDRDSTNQFIFIPELDEELVTKIYRRPTEAGVRYFHISSIHSHLIDTLAKANELNTTSNNDVILSIAKHIVKIVHTLPHWVKRTSGECFSDRQGSESLSMEARSFRNNVMKANDPYKLILEELPTIFGEDIRNRKTAERLSKTLLHVISELEGLHGQLMDTFTQIIENGLNAKLDDDLKERCKLVAKSAKRPDTKELASRLVKYLDKKASIEQVVSLSIGAPEKNWTDTNIRNGLDELQNQCTQFRRIETFSSMNGSDRRLSKPLALITTDENGGYISVESFVMNKLESDKEVKSTMKSIERSIKDISQEKKIAALSHLLQQCMSEPSNV